MIKIDWNNAPDGATHANWRINAEPLWMKSSGTQGWEWFVNGEWTHFGGSRSFLGECYARPVTSATWNGEGLPPVGTVCEARRSTTGDWQAVRVVDHQGSVGTAALRQLEGPQKDSLWWSDTFRPTRTSEQIAAEERDSAIEELFQASGLRARDGGRVVAELIYEAGYRKQVTP